MNRSSLPELLGDLDEVISRIKDAGLPVAALERARRSLPTLPESPVWTESRRAFRRARELSQETQRDIERITPALRRMRGQ